MMPTQRLLQLNSNENSAENQAFLVRSLSRDLSIN